MAVAVATSSRLRVEAKRDAAPLRLWVVLLV